MGNDCVPDFLRALGGALCRGVDFALAVPPREAAGVEIKAFPNDAICILVQLVEQRVYQDILTVTEQRIRFENVSQRGNSPFFKHVLGSVFFFLFFFFFGEETVPKGVGLEHRQKSKDRRRSKSCI